VPSAAIGTDAFQECDIRGITMPITKHNFLVTDPADIPRPIAEAFHIATTGRPGPVLVDIPRTSSAGDGRWYWPTDARPARLQARTTRPHPSRSARRPS
jgi:acetolactate synthase-1/2/3 large subunit